MVNINKILYDLFFYLNKHSNWHEYFMLPYKTTNKISQQAIFSYNLVIMFCNILVITCQVLNVRY
jgi:hypothetical protein